MTTLKGNFPYAVAHWADEKIQHMKIIPIKQSHNSWKMRLIQGLGHDYTKQELHDLGQHLIEVSKYMEE